jgi:hypothetical protein
MKSDVPNVPYYNKLYYCDYSIEKYDKQDQQWKAAFHERNPHMTQQQEPMARSPDGPKQNQDRAKYGQVNH